MHMKQRNAVRRGSAARAVCAASPCPVAAAGRPGWPQGLAACLLLAAQLHPVAQAQSRSADKPPLFIPTPQAAPQVVPAAKPVRRVAVQRFEITGNTLLAPAELDAAVAPYTGERTLVELKQAAAVVQELYRRAGHGAVLAYLPPQAVEDGKVWIKVLEGRIAGVVVTGNSAFSAANIRRSLPQLAIGVTPQVRVLDAQVRLANENPAKQVALTLEPGQQQGEVDAHVLVTEQIPKRWALALDNTGTTATGVLRATLGLQQAALWDLDHQLALQMQMAPDKPEAVTVLSAGYRMPLYSQGLMVDAFAALSDVDGGTTGTAAGPLQFSGRGRMWSLRLSRMLQRRGELDQRLGLSLNERAYLNNCSIEGLPAGACGSAGESVIVRPLALDYGAQFGRPYGLSFNALLSHNLPWGGAHTSAADFDAVRPGAPKRYTTLRAGLAGELPMHAWALRGRFDAQLSGQALVAGERFSATGMNAVRGYDEREVIGDQGAVLSLELVGPDLARRWSERFSSARLLAFVDAGQVSNHLGTPCIDTASRCSLTALGAGARVGVAGVQLRVDVAHALSRGGRTERGDNRLHFLASYGF